MYTLAFEGVGHGFANAVVRYGFIDGSVVAPATSDEDRAPAKTALGGEVTKRRGTKDAEETNQPLHFSLEVRQLLHVAPNAQQLQLFEQIFAGNEMAGGEATASCGSEGAATAAFRAALRWKRD